MRLFKRIFSGLIFSTLGFGLSGYELDRKLSEKEKELVQIYDEFVKSTGYSFLKIKYIPEITEVKKCWDDYEEEYDPSIKRKLAGITNIQCWRVTFLLPDDYMGGTPVVFIDKRTMKVLRSYNTQ
ncbi:hypothetical protein [Leptospira santarosai]|uniref:hypothetical protein n=1 Tax=Leptospira santarosai TaxID=28183 RepID=UPI00062D21E9|nr:hypothetical protein [Leptospira santarosai]AVV78338.1 Uncharacterized protein XB15_00541 [Leptospira santarosai]MDI7226589.1 hypothetical protein [Leptospira santarosai]ONF82578.1 hypothetical protein BWD13_19865 [Leptospira santarosai serovar Grippotyphosa]